VPESWLQAKTQDGHSHRVVAGELDAEDALAALVARTAPFEGDWVEVEGGGAVKRRLVRAESITSVDLFVDDRP
jgi:hypothetical protein